MTASIERDNLLGKFAVLAYGDRSAVEATLNADTKANGALANWTVLHSDIQPDGGFAAYAFQNSKTGEVIISYRGTDSGLGDGAADLAIMGKKWCDQFTQGMQFAQKVTQDVAALGISPASINVTGHSLGGTISQIVSKAFGLDGATLDPGSGAALIVKTTDFTDACRTLGLPADRPIFSSFNNYMVAGSLVSSGTQNQLGQNQNMPGLDFSTGDKLKTGLLTLLLPPAGVAYGILGNQAVNLHASAQISQALDLIFQAGVDTTGGFLLKQETISRTNPVTGFIENVPTGNFLVTNQKNEILVTMRFSGTLTDRKLEILGANGTVARTLTSAVTKSGEIQIGISDQLGNKTIDLLNLSNSGAPSNELLAFVNTSLGITQVSNFNNGVASGNALIEGIASLDQLNQEAALAGSFSQAVSLARAETAWFTGSNPGTSQALTLADNTPTSTALSSKIYTGGVSAADFVNNQINTDNRYQISAAQQQSTRADLSADPVTLALQDGVLAVRLAQNNPSTLNVLTALQKVLLAGNTLSPDILNTTATLLNTTPSDVNNLILNGGATLNSIIAAYQNPTPLSVASAAMKLLQSNIPLTDGLKLTTARILMPGVTDTDAMKSLNNMLSYGGAGLAVVSALKNPTPQNIVQSSQQIVSAIDAIKNDPSYTQLLEGLRGANVALSLVDFAKNPNPNTALSATMSIAAFKGWLPPQFAAALIIAELVLPGPTTKVINEVYNSANSIVNTIGSALGSVMNGVGNVLGGVLNGVSSFFGGLFGPLALNLTGGNVYTTNLTASSAPLFDINGDGSKVRTGWIAPNEGFLVRDLNGDGQINSVREMFSERNSTSGQSAFGMLSSLDGNQDGKIDKTDRTWSDLKIWVDKNGDGVSQTNELYTLGQLGIASINLNATQHFAYDNGNVIGDTSTFSYTDGSMGQIADAILSTQTATASAGNLIVMGNNATTVQLSNGKTAQLINGSGQTVNVSNTGVNVVISQGGNTVVAGSNNGVILVGGAGDVLNAGNGLNTTLVGNGGASLIGNASNSTFLVSGAANTVTTGSGRGNVQVNGNANVINAVAGSDVVTVAGTGNTVLIGSGDTVNLSQGGNTLALSGNNSTVNSVVGGNTLYIAGAGDVLNVNGGNIMVGSNTSASLNGSANTLVAGTNDTLRITGNNNVATAGAGSQVAVRLASGLETVSVASGTVRIANDVSLLGAGSAASVNVYAANGVLNQQQTLSQSAAGLSINVKNLGAAGALLDNTNASISANGASASVNTVVYANNDNVNLAGTVIASTANRVPSATTIQMTSLVSNAHLNLGGNSINADVGSTVTVQGSQNVVTVAAYDTASVYGNQNVVTVAGQYDATAVYGSNNQTWVGGISNTTLTTGSANNTQANGIGNYTVSSGTGNTTLAYGTSNNTQSNGNYDYTLSNGVSNTTLGYGSGNNTQGTGVANYTLATGVGNTTLAYGTSNNTQSNANYDYTLSNGVSNTTLGYGSGNNTQASGTANYTLATGVGNTTLGYGVSNNTQSNGSYDYTLSNGVSNTTLGYGSSNNTQGSGVANYTLATGIGNTTLGYGSGNNTQSNGSYDYTLSNGISNTTLGYGSSNTTVASGYGNNTQSLGVNDNTVSSGTLNTTLSYGANDVTIGVGAYNNTQSLGNNDFTATNGNFNTTLSYGNNSTSISRGSFDTAISTSSNDTTCAVGVGVVAIQALPNQLTGVSSQASLNSLIASMAAFAPPTSGQAGLPIGSQPSQPFLLAAGY